MLKAVQRDDKGLLVLLGLSSENLALLREGRSIQFPAGQVELGDGVFVIAHASDSELPQLRALAGTLVRALVVLDDELFATLRRGEALELDLRSLGHPEPGLVAVLHGETEEAMVQALARVGIVTDRTRIQTLGVPQPDLGHALRRASPRARFSFEHGIAGLGALVCAYAAIVEGREPLVLALCGLVLAGYALWPFAARWLRH